MGNKLHNRKYPRLKDYDYSRNGSYFVTFCVENMNEILCTVVGSGFHARPQINEQTIYHKQPQSIIHARPYIELTEIGKEIQNTINYVIKNDEEINIPKYIIMPNHVHMIIVLNNIGYSDTAVGHGSPTLQSVVGRIKSYAAKRYSEIHDKKYQTFWQRSFHEHIIRNADEYQRIWKYIDENPQKWAEDCYYIKT